MSGDDAIERAALRFAPEAHIRADDSYVPKFGLTHQKSSQFAKGFRDASCELTSPSERRSLYGYGGDPLIPKLQLHHPVAAAANRTIGQHDLRAQSVEPDPKKNSPACGCTRIYPAAVVIHDREQKR